MSDWEPIVDSVARHLRTQGLGIAEPFAADWYNSSVPADVGAGIPVAEPAGADTLCILVANTKDLWPVFIEACRNDPDLAAGSNPLDTYVQRAVLSASSSLPDGVLPRLYWAHEAAPDLVGGAQYVAMQRLASAIGMAYLDPISHLCLHPKYGPWFSMRAVMVFDGVKYDGPRHPPVANPMDVKTQQYVRLVAMSARNSSSSSGDLSSRASSPLTNSAAAGSGTAASAEAAAAEVVLAPLPPLPRSCSGGLPRSGSAAAALLRCTSSTCVGSPVSHGSPLAGSPGSSSSLGDIAEDAVRARWEKWVAVRDAPCPGHPRRFYKDQIEYHYTQSRDALARAIAASAPLSRPPSVPHSRSVSRSGSALSMPWVLCSGTVEQHDDVFPVLAAGC